MRPEFAPEIIGLAGTNGSGKDTVGKILADEYGYLFVSLTDILRAELKREGLSTKRENMRHLSSQWRQQYGLGVLVDRAKEEFTQSKLEYRGLAMGSIRNPGEADAIHDSNGIVLWIDADPQIRYQRVIENSAQRGADRAVDDNKTFQEFMAEEAEEMNHPEVSDGTTLSGSEVKAKSDVFINNNGNDLNELRLLIVRQLNLDH